ncbi:hypothetical protein GALMADRAFT_243402 [Galerina marginata CBS 339.88]|uniref:Uncharacterized protein n=1 Tax=Galerina marginata (strain CBS 339.88) TaxID=685588 RepID=A0A067TAI6_GALM3|nr:hypothetical protein GALMADRAFT_243402 [Galerina marginata CBS 339.88]
MLPRRFLIVGSVASRLLSVRSAENPPSWKSVLVALDRRVLRKICQRNMAFISLLVVVVEDVELASKDFLYPGGLYPHID